MQIAGNHTAVSKKTVAAFDFDVTITTKDTFVPFLVLAFGRLRVYQAFLWLALDGFMVLFKIESRDRFKELIVNALFKGQSVDRLKNIGQEHARKIKNLVRPSALHRISWHKERGHRLVMVSASLDLYLEPIAAELGFNDLLCTRLSSDGCTFDGGLSGRNCRGPEKAVLLKNLLGDLSGFEIHGYGDSNGDNELLAVSTHPHWRPFESGGEFAVANDA